MYKNRKYRQSLTFKYRTCRISLNDDTESLLQRKTKIDDTTESLASKNDDAEIQMSSQAMIPTNTYWRIENNVKLKQKM